MSGEASERLIGLAAQAAARLARRTNLISDMYSPESPVSDVRELLLSEVMDHYDTSGHWSPSEGCTHPVCLKAAAFIQGALAMMGQQEQANGRPV